MQYYILSLDIVNAILHNTFMLHKTKGQQDQVIEPALMAFDSVASWQSGLMRQPVKLCNGALSPFAGPNPALATITKFAPLVVEATSGAILRPKPKNEVVTPIVILAHRLEESKGQNDVPQLRDRDGKGWEIWKESNSAIPVQTVREALQRASGQALGLCTAPAGEGEYDPPLSCGREQREGHSPPL